jgi:DNA-binding transcriptional regulator YhcF (GntR family)
MNVNTIQKAYEMAVEAMMEATPTMPRKTAEQAVEAIAELVLAVINSELSEEEIQNAIKH